MTAKLKTAVLGATGYSGLELARLLDRHPHAVAPLLLRRSADELGTIVLMATHSLEAIGKADTIVSLHDGRVESVNPTEKVTAKA